MLNATEPIHKISNGDTMNPSNFTLVPTHAALPEDRLKQLQRELRHAWAQTSRADLVAWGAGSGWVFAGATKRRVKNVVGLVRTVGQWVGNEAVGGYGAWHEARLGQHLQKRGVSAASEARRVCAQTVEFGGRMARAFKSNPQEAGVQLMTVVLTSLVVSGGPDGNGGAPDLDLMMGIGAHRSILSHSILMGAALETGILSLLQLMQLVHVKLPAQHDPLWDSLHTQANAVALSASQGVSIGMAYHLLVDGLVQPAPYHDLPFPMPIEVHQAVFVANGVGEVVDVGKKNGAGAAKDK